MILAFPLSGVQRTKKLPWRISASIAAAYTYMEFTIPARIAELRSKQYRNLTDNNI